MSHARLPPLSLVEALESMDIKGRARFNKIYQEIEAQFHPLQRKKLRNNLFSRVTKDTKLIDLQWHLVALIYVYSTLTAGAAVREKCFAFLIQEASHHS